MLRDVGDRISSTIHHPISFLSDPFGTDLMYDWSMPMAGSTPTSTPAPPATPAPSDVTSFLTPSWSTPAPTATPAPTDVTSPSTSNWFTPALTAAFAPTDMRTPTSLSCTALSTLEADRLDTPLPDSTAPTAPDPAMPIDTTDMLFDWSGTAINWTIRWNFSVFGALFGTDWQSTIAFISLAEPAISIYWSDTPASPQDGATLQTVS
ncbi:hypothetical protein FRC08_000049 [Ceratobasidium sp. 394]|nr:hypothetical protein FRC08_000049 [Ceratobasidium sp. 394]